MSRVARRKGASVAAPERGPERSVRPRNVYIAFALIAVGTAIVSQLFADHPAVDPFGPNLASEAVGILLISLA